MLQRAVAADENQQIARLRVNDVEDFVRHVDSQGTFSDFLFFFCFFGFLKRVFWLFWCSPYILVWFEWNYGLNRTITVSLPQSCRCG